MNTALDVARLKSVFSAQGITQSELAMVSGISRVQISRILSGRHNRVRQSTLEGLARALRVDPVELSAGGVLQAFRKFVSKEHAFLDFRGIGNPHMQRQRIEDVFVDLLVYEEVRKVEETNDGCTDGRLLLC